MGDSCSTASDQFYEKKFRSDLTFIPTAESGDTSILHLYKPVTISEGDEEGQISREISAALWQILAQRYFQDIVSRSSLQSHIKKVRVSVIMVGGESKISMESYAFVMARAKEMAKAAKDQVSKGSFEGGENMYSGELLTQMRLTRKELKSSLSCENVRGFLSQFADEKWLSSFKKGRKQSTEIVNQL